MSGLARRPVPVLLACAIASWTLAYGRHGFALEYNPDSETYLHFDWWSLASVLSSIRTFGYPLLLKSVEATVGLDRLPLVQWVVWVVAAGVLYRGLVRSGCRDSVAAWAGGTLMLTHAALTFPPLVLTDSTGCALAVAAAGCFLAMRGHAPSWGWFAGLAVLTFLAYQTRPAYLFLIPLWPLAGLLLDRWLVLRDQPWRMALQRCAMLLVLTAVPFLGFCTLRSVVVGHWGLVSFGGCNLIGIVAQWLDPTDVAALPEDLRPLANDMLERRARLEHLEAPDSYLAMETMYAPFVVSVAIPAAKQRMGTDAVGYNRALSQLSFRLLALHPREYARWMVWNSRHAVRQTILLLSTDRGISVLVLVLLVVQSMSLWTGPDGAVRPAARDNSNLTIRQQHLERHLLFWLALAFAAAKTLLVMLVEPAIGRYMIAAVVLLPPATAVLVFHALLDATPVADPAPAAGS